MGSQLEQVPIVPSIESDNQPGSVLAKAHLLLNAFAQGTTTLGLTELSRRSGVSKGSAHRLGSELVELGYLTRTPKGYQLGWRMFELGQLVPDLAILRYVARPAMQDLRMLSRAVVNLAVPQGVECIYLERIAGRRELAVVEAVADRVPSYSTASGRVFLAHSAQAVDCLDRTALGALGARSQAEATETLTRIRHNRFAEEQSTCLRGIKSISVPVMYPGSEHVIAAVSGTVPVDRNDDRQLLHALWATAADISRGLHRPSLLAAAPHSSAGIGA